MADEWAEFRAGGAAPSPQSDEWASFRSPAPASSNDDYAAAVSSPEGQELKTQLIDKAQKTLLKQTGREGAGYAAADAFSNSFGLNIPRNIAALLQSRREGIPFDSAYSQQRDISEAARAQHPGTSLFADVGGGVVQAAMLPEIGAAKALGPGAGALEKLLNMGRRVVGNPIGGGAVQGGVGSGLATLADTKDPGQAAQAGAVGAGLGGAIGGALARPAAGMAKSFENKATGLKIPTQEQVKGAAEGLYKQADDAGMMVHPEAIAQLHKEFEDTLAQRGVSPRSYNQNFKAFMTQLYQNGLPNMSEKDIPRYTTLKGLDLIRQEIGKLSQSDDPGLRQASHAMKEHFDDWLNYLPHEQGVAWSAVNPREAIDALTGARKNWHMSRKSEAIQNAIEEADLMGQVGKTADPETKLRNAMGSLWVKMNQANKAGFTPDELDAIKDVGAGNFTRNTLRRVGNLAPDNFWKLAAELGPGGLALAAGSPHGAATLATGIGIGAAGSAAKSLAARGTRKSAEGLDELIRAGGTNQAAGRVSRGDVQDASKKIVGSVTALENAPSPEEMTPVEPLSQAQADRARGGVRGATPNAKALALPKVGDIKRGYRYIGGEPHNRDSWERVE